MIARLRRAGDGDSARVLEVIYREEIGHVHVGARWFAFVCAARGREPASAWRALVTERFTGALRPPFNDDARARSGLPRSWYEPLAAA